MRLWLLQNLGFARYVFAKKQSIGPLPIVTKSSMKDLMKTTTIPSPNASNERPGLIRNRRFSTVPVEQKADTMVKWLEENKARDVVSIDVRTRSSYMDMVLIATSSSMRHARSLAEGLAKICTDEGYEFFRFEGFDVGQWILVDCNDIIIHIFQQDTRELFNIEGLLKQAPVVHDGFAADFDDERASYSDE